MKFSAILTVAACLPPSGTVTVHSFQQVPRVPIAARASARPRGGAAIATPAAAVTAARTFSSQSLPTRPSSALLFSATAATTDEEKEEEEVDEAVDDDGIEELRQELARLRESLDEARVRQVEASEDVGRLREEREEVVSQTDMVIARLKRGLSEAISDLSDQIEGAQDGLRTTGLDTRSEIAGIQAAAKEREARTKEEISELERRIADLRREANAASRDRDLVKKSIDKDARAIRAASRREVEDAKSAAATEKMELRNETWELENRIGSAEADALRSQKELEEEKRFSLPKISSLKDALQEMRRKMSARADDLREQRAAKEMFFDQSLKGVKLEKKADIDVAKSVSEEEMSDEDTKLEEATSRYEAELEAREEELRRVAELASKPVEPAGDGAILKAKKDRIDLYQEKHEAISATRKAGEEAVRSAALSHSAIQDQYDAEYENEIRNQKREKAAGERRLRRVDEGRERRSNQLRREKEEVARSLSGMMQEKGAAAEREYEGLVSEKSAALAKSVSQTMAATNEIQTIRSNTVFTQHELNTLRSTSRRNEDTLYELEKERGSFRKQVRRTISVAIGRIVRRRNKGKQ